MTELLSIDEARSALGLRPWTTFEIITDSLGRKWDAAKHPRDRKGRFIEVGGILKLFDGESAWGTGEVIATPNVGSATVKVTAAPGFPEMVGTTINVDPQTTEQVKAKAMLNKATYTPPAPTGPQTITPDFDIGPSEYDSLATLRAKIPKSFPGFKNSNLNDAQKKDVRNAGFALDDAMGLTPGSGEHSKAVDRAAFLLNRGGYPEHANSVLDREFPDSKQNLTPPELPKTPGAPSAYPIPTGKAIDLHWDDPDAMGKLAQHNGDMLSHTTVDNTQFDVGEIYSRPYSGWSKQLLHHGKGSNAPETMRLLAIKEDDQGNAFGIFRDGDTNAITLEKLDGKWKKSPNQARLVHKDESVVDPQDPDAHLPGEIEPPPTSTPLGEAPLTPTDGPNPEQYPYGPEVKAILDQLEEAQIVNDGENNATWNEVIGEAQGVFEDIPLHGTPQELKTSLIQLNDLLDSSHYGEGIAADDSAAFGEAQDQIGAVLNEIDDEINSVNPPPQADLTPDDGSPLDTSGWSLIGGQGGSNPGGTYEAPDGKKYYVKQSKSPQHAKVESLASDFYAAAGIDIPKVHLTTDGGVASEIVPGAKGDLKSHLNDPEYIKKIQEGFATDAWLANWDVAGLVFDNVVTGDDGNPWRIDTGGTLLYRAMGSPKGGAFGNTVGEIDTLRDPQMGPQAYKLFGNMTDADIAESAKRVMAITPDQIDELVDAKGFDPDVAEELKQKLKSRRMYLAQRFGLTALADEIKPVESKAEIPNSPFHIIEDTGLNGDGYHASGPWGKFGAAGVMVRHVEDDGTEKFLMVQRGNGVSSNKGKWQLPGGALDSNEDPYQGIARETSEELGASDEYLANMAPVGETIFDNGKGWQYTSVAADVPEKFDAVVDGWETGASGWFTRQEIEDMKNNGQLNPAFASGVDSLLDKWDTPAPEPTPAQSGTNNNFEQDGNIYTIPPGSSLGWGFVQLIEDEDLAYNYDAHVEDSETGYWIQYSSYHGGWTVYGPDGEAVQAIGNDFDSGDAMAESIDSIIHHDGGGNAVSEGNYIPATVEASPPPELTDASGGQSLPGANGKPIHVGTKVVSVTDGSIGEVVAFESNGTGVRVKMADGKIKGRKAHKLNALEVAQIPGYNAPETQDTPDANGYDVQNYNGGQYVVVPDDKSISDVALDLWNDEEFPYQGLITNEGYELTQDSDGSWTLSGPQGEVIADGYSKKEVLDGVVDTALGMPGSGPGPKSSITSKLTAPKQHAYWLGTDEAISDWLTANIPPGTDINDLPDGMQIGSDDGYTLELDKASHSWNLTGPNNENIDTFDFTDGTPDQIQQVIDDYKSNGGESQFSNDPVQASLDELSKEAWNVENGFGHNNNVIAGYVSKLNKINEQWKKGILTGEDVKQGLQELALEIEFGPTYDDYDTDLGVDKLKDLITNHVHEISTTLGDYDIPDSDPGGFQGQLMPNDLMPSAYMATADWDGNDFMTPDGYKVQHNEDDLTWDIISPSGEKIAKLSYVDVTSQIDDVIEEDKNKVQQFPVQNPHATNTLSKGVTVSDFMDSGDWKGGTIVTGDGYQVTFGPDYGNAFVWDSNGQAIDHISADPVTGWQGLDPNATLASWIDNVIEIDKDNKAGVGPPDSTPTKKFDVAAGDSIADYMENGDWGADGNSDITTEDGYQAKYSPGTPVNGSTGSFKVSDPNGEIVEVYTFNENLASESSVGEALDNIIKTHKDPVSQVIPYTAQWAPGSNAKPIFIGSKVQSVTGGETFIVKNFEPNGDGVKVIGADGKVKGRKLSKLKSMDEPPEWWTPQHPKTYLEWLSNINAAKAKKSGTTPEPSSAPLSTHAYEPSTPGKIVVPVYKPTLEPDTSSPWYDQPKPDTPTKEYSGALPWVPDGWLEAAKETYLLKPDKASANLEASKRWGVVKKVIDSGDMPSLDLLLQKKYINQELYDSATAQIKKVQKTNDEADKIFQVEMSKYKDDLVAWKKANGIDTAAFPGAPPLSTEAFVGGPADWTKAYPGTPTANAAIEAVKNNVGVADRGASFATDSGELRDLNVRAMRVIDRDGYEKLEFKFHVHESAGGTVASTLDTKGAKKDAGMHSDQAKKDTATGLRKYVTGFRHTDKDGTTRTWIDPETGARVQFTQQTSSPGINSRVYHNQVRIFMLADSTAADFEKTLRNIGIKDSAPATPEAIHKLKEDHLMQAGSGTFSESHTPVGADRAKRLADIKQKYGITIDDVEMVTDDSGFVRPMLRQEAAQKLVDYANVGGITHNVHNGQSPEIWISMFSGNRLGVIPTATRWSEGIGGSGSSQTADMKNRGSGSTFTRVKHGAGSDNHFAGSAMIMMHPLAAMRRLQFHAANHDAYGKYAEKQKLWDMVQGGPTEVTWEGGIPISDMWYAHIPSGIRQDVIDHLHGLGITEINGIPLEEFFILPGSTPPVVDETTWMIPTTPGASAGPAV